MLVKSYKTLPITVERGEGCRIWDDEGNRYLDMYAGHAVAATGHCHPKVVDAISRQAARLVFYSNVVDLKIRREATALLLSHAPAGISSALFANSGAEANENALKMAVLQTGRRKIVTFEGGWHGRTLLALNVTSNEKYRRQAPYIVPEIVDCPFGDTAALREVIDRRTAAVILEPVQSMAGCRTASAAFFQELRELTRQVGAYLIYDEVQTGIGRTGTMFFAGRHNVVPDIISLAKGIASGVPLCANLVASHVAERVEYGQFGATYGAGPLAMAAMKATLEVISEERLLERVTEVSGYLRDALIQAGAREVLGIGHLIGVRTHLLAADLQKRLLERRVITGSSDDPHILRLLPPLTLTLAEAEEFITIFKEAL